MARSDAGCRYRAKANWKWFEIGIGNREKLRAAPPKAG
jgi:hypothetical protein